MLVRERCREEAAARFRIEPPAIWLPLPQASRRQVGGIGMHRRIVGLAKGVTIDPPPVAGQKYTTVQAPCPHAQWRVTFHRSSLVSLG